ncbi:phosphatase [Thaumasiovibrio subtropicus]|uniref:phosphatase n=1 Tax=Thaumasiovibrio subtropicus TaxID=1891207 RepID=UPI000B34D63C|nr:phosphatase [Thaumasiovibrio subtropicus]
MKIRVDTHSHTIASTHAYSTVHDYIAIAKQKGIELFCITDHAPPMPDAPHWWHFGNLKVIPHVHQDIAILRGIEANIQAPEIGLGLPDELKWRLDLAIASFHEPVFPPASLEQNTEAMIAAIESGDCQIIGHPGNPNYPIDQEAVVLAAKANNVALEINNSSFVHSRTGSKPHCESLLQLIKRHKALISIGSDAHIAFDLGEVSESLRAIQKANIDEAQIVTASPAKFIAFLTSHDRKLSPELLQWASHRQE